MQMALPHGILTVLDGTHMGYKQEAVKGIFWVGSLRIFTRIIAFLRIIILARLLTPEQFGIFSIALLVLALIDIFTETGINVFLVQEKEDIDKYVDTSWIISIARGIFISLVIITNASFVVSFYKSPTLYSFLLVICILPVVKGFINPSIAKFQKELKFNIEFFYKSTIFLIETFFSVLIVLLTKSAIGLIWGLIIGAFFEVIFSFFIIKPTPHFIFKLNLLKKVIARGKWVTMSGVFNYLFHNGDNIVVGRMLGVSVLGLYDMTYRISMLPITEIADVVSRVTLPVYVKMSHDTKRLKSAFLKTLCMVGIPCLFIGIIFYFFPKQIILIVLGEKWIEAVPILQILTIFGVIRAISGISSVIFLSVKKQEYVTIVTLVSFLVLALTIVPFIKIFGIIGAGLSAVFASIIAIPFMIYFLIKVFKE